MEKHGHLQLDPAVRKLVLAVSAATIDRVLTPVRKGAGVRRRRPAKKRVSRAIPIKAFSGWQDPAPGFLAIDIVVQGGGSLAGEELPSLVVTDVCSGWVEAVPLLAREQHLVIAGTGPAPGTTSRDRLGDRLGQRWGIYQRHAGGLLPGTSHHFYAVAAPSLEGSSVD